MSRRVPEGPGGSQRVWLVHVSDRGERFLEVWLPRTGSAGTCPCEGGTGEVVAMEGNSNGDRLEM